jgi:hypothetical protein
MAGLHRSAVAVIPWQNHNGAKVLCDDGSLWEVRFTEDGGASWTDLKSPLPGSTAAAAWIPERARADSQNAAAPAEPIEAKRVPK